MQAEGIQKQPADHPGFLRLILPRIALLFGGVLTLGWIGFLVWLSLYAVGII